MRHKVSAKDAPFLRKKKSSCPLLVFARLRTSFSSLAMCFFRFAPGQALVHVRIQQVIISAAAEAHLPIVELLSTLEMSRPLLNLVG